MFAQCSKKGGSFDYKLFETKYNDEVLRRHLEAAAAGKGTRAGSTSTGP